MIPRQLKAAYYLLLAVPMRINGLVYKAFRAPTSGQVKVHLGPGQKNYLPGWINVDANLFTARIDLWADLRNPLPFRAGTVDIFYSHHVIEHLPDALLPFHIKEMFRCLKPGGCIRVGGPNGDNAIRKFLEGDSAWFSEFPDRRKSIGGRLANFILCRGEHLTILTFSYLEELLTEGGFSNIRQCHPKKITGQPALIDELVLATELEGSADAPCTLIVEAVKPA